MKKYLNLSALITFICTAWLTAGIAQPAFEKYQTESIYLQNSSFVKNGEGYPLGLFNRKLKKEMAISPDAMLVYKQYEKNRNTSYILAIISGATAGVALSLSDDNDGLRTGMTIGAVVSYVAVFPFTIKSRKQFYKAIWIRNGDILK